MNIGFFHGNDSLPLTDAGSIQAWQISLNLVKLGHHLFGPTFAPFPHVKRIYSSKWDTLKLLKSIDVLVFILDGVPQLEHLTLMKLASFRHISVVWIINAPLEEGSFFSSHSSAFHQWWLQQQRKFLATFVSAAICVSQPLAQYAKKELHIPHVTVIPNGSDPDLFNPARKLHTPLEKLKGSFNVLWAGNPIYNWQALDVIVEVAERCWKKDKNILFILTVNSSQSWVRIPQRENILILPSLEYQKIAGYIQHADVCLCLYHSRLAKIIPFYNSSMKLFDYMAMAKPTIVSRLPTLNKIIDDKETGLLTDTSPREVTNLILQLKKDSVLRKKLGKNARKKILTYYNWQRMAEEIELVLNKVTT
jgi:glycosyltransferase involved in cell wall biosynthesis